MKRQQLIVLLAAIAAMPAVTFAQATPTGDTPVGLQPATNAESVSGNNVDLQEDVPHAAATTTGQNGWLKMDGHGAYWWSPTREDGQYSWMSAPQGTYTLAESNKSVVVK